MKDVSLASNLEGKIIGTWEILKKRIKTVDDHSGAFSSCYEVRNTEDNSFGFLKAINYQYAFQIFKTGKSLTDFLQDLTANYNYEKDLLEFCKEKRMSRIVTAIAHGEYREKGELFPVPYLIFETATGSLKNIAAKETLDIAWKLGIIHGLLVGLSQLHQEKIAHQNVACEYRPGNNISPGQQIAAVLRKDDQNSLVNFHWGLIPSWAKDPSIGNKMINARAETVSEKPSFREAFKKRRCLIVADGFYEWQKLDRKKKPYKLSLKSGQPFGFAGLYETWISPENTPINTCTIITTDSNELIKPIHDRMPVIMPRDTEALWIDPDNHNQKELLAILKPYSSEEMTLSPVDSSLLYKPKAQESAFFSN
jgi:putative SOS response-associated peptidase YedK